nr:hypothetical protein [Tanacetum cinerariifolium]
MSKKQKDLESIKQNTSHKPIDYEKLNRITKDFEKRFTPQQELSAEQALWLRMSDPTSKPSDALPVKFEDPKELPKISLVNESLKKFKFHLAKFDSVVKIRTTHNACTEDRGARHRSRSRTMDTTIDQQVVRDEALVPHAKRLRIGRSNFRLLSDIKYKESTLQLVYDVLHLTSFFKASWMNTRIQRRAMKCIILGLRRLSSITSCQRILLFQGGTSALLPIELINKDIKNSNAYKECYAVATGVTLPKPKASAQKTRSSSNTTITPPTAAAGTHEAQQLKLVTKRSLQQTHISQASGSCIDEGTGSIPGVPDVPTDVSEEELSWNSTDKEGDEEGKDGDSDDDNNGNDGEEGDGDDDDEDDDGKEGDDDDDQKVERDNEKDDEEDEGSDDEQPSDEEEFIHLSLSTPTEEETRDEERHDKEEEEDELYKDININQRRGIQTTQEVEDSHVTLTLVNLDEQTMNEQLEAEVLNRSSNSSKTSYVVAADLSEMELKKILIEKMKGNKDVTKMMLIKTKNPLLDQTGGLRDAEKERSQSQQALHKKITTRSADMSTQGSQSRQMLHPEWFSQQQEPPTPDRDWNKTLPATHESIQPWISELVKQYDSRSSFNELMDTPVDFSNFLINRLKVDTLTPELLAGPTYELLKGSCKSLQYPHNMLKPLPLIPNNRGPRVIPFHYFINNDLAYLHGGASSRKYTISITKTNAADYGHIKWIEDLVPRTMWVQEPIGYDKHALWGVSHWGRKCQQFYGFAVNREFARDVYYKRVEDLQLGVESYQKKLNLTKPDTYHSDLKCKEAYIAYSNPRGFIYQNKDKKNRLMRIDELHKFNDGTLTNVRTALDDRLKGIRMQYLPRSIWRKSDKDRAATMIQSIDKRLKTMRIMRSLERFIGGRLYEGDFRMLQRTI